MSLTRRSMLTATAALPVLSAQDSAAPAIHPGPFKATRESLKAYQAPEWFRDAKFGIWAHWGPQSAPEFGDWYARNMYIEGHRQYKYHCEKYGHPSKFGFKDIIPTWKAERFDPEGLMDLYKRAGARYFVSMGVHHDNFDLWNSKLNNWNSVKMGPRKDIVGLFAAAARKRGLRFGVSEHLAVSYHWFQKSHLADTQGPFKGIPYDGADPKFSSLYHETHTTPDHPWTETGVTEKWKQHYFDRMKDLIDSYQPDLLYTDGPIFFEKYGLAVTAHLYNSIAAKYQGRVEAVYANKGKNDCVNGTCVLDLERGIVDNIRDEPWQTDTCIGTWHYNKEARYKSPKLVIDMLVDIVSRNGNLLLNFPLPSSGALDSQELYILDEISRWMSVNGDAIYGTRPWKVYGSSPAPAQTSAALAGTGGHHVAEAFNERSRRELNAADVRYVTKGRVIYAFSMGIEAEKAVFNELGLNSPQQPGKIANVELLGHPKKLTWSQDAAALTVSVPMDKPSRHALAFRVTFA